MRIWAKVYGALKPSGIFGEEIAQIDIRHQQPKWFDALVGWFTRLIEVGGRVSTF